MKAKNKATPKRRSRLFIIVFVIGIVCLYLWHSLQPRQAPGGLFGTVTADLRCPANLTGVGPQWRNIQIGVSSVDDLRQLYLPYMTNFNFNEYDPLGTTFAFATPHPPLGNVSQTADPGGYAPVLGISVHWKDFKPELGLPELVKTCVVDGKIAALSIFSYNESGIVNLGLPQTIQDMISLLGEPTLISWQWEDVEENRVVHWPDLGISAHIVYGYQVHYMYYYPFVTDDYEHHWPMNALVTEPYDTDWVLDNMDLPAVVATVSAAPSYPTRTPTNH